MDPIIKTARISPASFSLGLRGGKPGAGKPQAVPKEAMPLPRAGADEGAQKTMPKDFPAASVQPAMLTASGNSSIPSQPVSRQLEPKVESNIDAAKAERDEVFKRALEEGRRQGLEEGRLAAEKENAQALEQIGSLFSSLRDLRAALFEEMENTAVEIVFEAVTKMVGRAVEGNDAARHITYEAIEQARGRQQLTVRVSPKDFEMVQAAMAQARSGELLAKEVHVVPDNIVHLGGCVIETEAGSLDARLEIKLQRLKDTLLGVRRSNSDV